jgi:hypothetical protein
MGVADALLRASARAWAARVTAIRPLDARWRVDARMGGRGDGHPANGCAIWRG